MKFRFLYCGTLEPTHRIVDAFLSESAMENSWSSVMIMPWNINLTDPHFLFCVFGLPGVSLLPDWAWQWHVVECAFCPAGVLVYEDNLSGTLRSSTQVLDSRI